MTGCLLIRGIPKLHRQLKLVLQTLTLFFSHLFMIVTCEQMTIKHSLYMSKVPYVQKGPVWFSFEIRSLEKNDVLQVLQTRGSTKNKF